MTKAKTIDVALLRQLIAFDPSTGEMWLKERDPSDFKSEAWGRYWNRRYAGKPAMNTPHDDGYVCGNVAKTTLKAHRVIWALHYGEWPDGEIDHINGIKTDNRIANLRVVTIQENLRNKPRYKSNTTGVTGVVWHKRMQRYQAHIGNSGKLLHLGTFTSLEGAKKAREAAEVDLGYHKNHGR